VIGVADLDLELGIQRALLLRGIEIRCGWVRLPAVFGCCWGLGPVGGRLRITLRVGVQTLGGLPGLGNDGQSK
jgi:hypothetical protein